MTAAPQKLLDLKDFLDHKVALYNRPGFIANDPISIPHRFTKKQDIEISGLFAAVLAWGQRVTIIRKCDELLNRMDMAPCDFVLHHGPADMKRMEDFKHRTFNRTDLNYFITFLKSWYAHHDSLEELFLVGRDEVTVEKGLINFHNQFFGLEDYPARTRKHIATPERRSACKRINMYLRWMVRKDDNGVDFGIWNTILPSQLIIPIDVHVGRVAKKLGILQRTQNDWQAAVELTNYLKQLNPTDPVLFDYALFGLGVVEKY